MNAKSMATLAIGLVVGAAVMFFVGTSWPQAQAQGKAQAWEYRVATFHSNGSLKFEERLNKAAADGWEYAGMLSLVTSPQAAEGYVALKRPKN
jgi:hypothetical protein